MAISIVFTARALRDMDGIWEYISEILKNPRAADDTVSKIRHSIGLLKTSPEMGTRLAGAYLRGSPYRFLVSGNYMAFYVVEAESVYVVRVLYGKRNYYKLLEE